MGFTLLFGVLFIVYAEAQIQQRSMEDAASQRFQEFSELAKSEAMVRMNTDSFKYFVHTRLRNYNVMVLLTSHRQRDCPACVVANEEFHILATSYKRQSNQIGDRLFFASVDYEEASEVFQMLNLNFAPVIMLFPSRSSSKRVEKVDFRRYGMSAAVLARWVADRVGVPIRVVRPFEYNYHAIGLLTCFGIVVLLVNRLNVHHIRTFWGLIALICILTMLGGQMWNNINSPPMLYKSRTGENVYIHPDSHAQFVSESLIVSTLYAVVTASVIMMDAGAKRRVLLFVSLAMLVVSFTIILTIFRFKNRGYPYSPSIK